MKIGKVFGYAINMKRIYIIITILAISCAPVRKSYYENDGNETSYSKQVKSKKEITEREKRQNKSEDSNAEYKPDSNINDETYSAKPEIYYPDETSDTISLNENSKRNEIASKQQEKSYRSNDPNTEVYSENISIVANSNNDEADIVLSYDNALNLFNSGNYTSSLEKFKALSETLKENDTLIYETQYYIAECHIAKNEFSKAMDILKKLEITSDNKSEIMQKTLVRLGQMYCILNMKKDANGYFKKLKSRFPHSNYNKVANCN